MTVAGMVSRDGVSIDDTDNVSTSFPGFVEAATSVGLVIDVEQGR